jgi:hypothetical protein
MKRPERTERLNSYVRQITGFKSNSAFGVLRCVYYTYDKTYFRNIIVNYWRETWSLTLRGEHRLSVFENRVLR